MANDLKGVKVKGTAYHFDYNELSNKPFGEVKRVPLSPFIEGPITMDSSHIQVPCAEYLSIGDIYTVTWDGKEVTCIATFQQGNPSSVQLTHIPGGSEDYPFYINYVPNSTPPALYIGDTDGEVNHTVKVEHNIASKISSKDLDVEPVSYKSVLTVIDGTMEMYPCTLEEGEITVSGFVGALPSEYDTSRLKHRLVIDGCLYEDDGGLDNFHAVNEPNSISLYSTYGGHSLFEYDPGSWLKGDGASLYDFTEEFLSTINDDTFYLVFMTDSEMPTHTIKLDCGLGA